MKKRGRIDEAETRFTMDSLPNLRWKNSNKGVWKYCSYKISSLLSKMQAGNCNWYSKTENGSQQRARRLKRRACYPDILPGAGSDCVYRDYSILIPLLERNAVRTASITGSKAAASSSLHSLMSKHIRRMDGLLFCRSSSKSSLASVLSARTILNKVWAWDFHDPFPYLWWYAHRYRICQLLLPAWGQVQTGFSLRR